MSRDNVEVLRQRVTVSAKPRRRLEERLALRFPRVLALAANAIWTLPPRSRLRQVVLRRALQVGLEAANRADWGATFLLYHPGCESTFPPQLATLGEPGTRGVGERIRWQRSWSGEWGGFRFDPQTFIDLGNRHLVVGHIEGSGSKSGAAAKSEWAALYTSSAGRVIREQIFLDRDQALKAAGLSE